MLPRIEDENKKSLLNALISLGDDDDFIEVMDYLMKAKVHCAEQACIQHDEEFAKKHAGGFLLLRSFKNLCETAGAELENLKKRKK